MSAQRLRTLIVDDEPFARSTLRLLLGRDPEIEVVGECADGRSALEAIGRLQPELLFLDIQMAELDGFGLLEALGPGNAPVVVFVTAFEEHALDAFDVEAADYLLKPYDDDRFRRALERAKARAAQRSPRAPTSVNRTWTERLTIRESGKVWLLPVEEIDWIEADDYYVQVHAAGRSHLVREPLRDFEAQLDPRRFVRIHRSAIVQLSRIVELRSLPHGEYLVRLRDGTELRMSRSRRRQLHALLGLP